MPATREINSSKPVLYILKSQDGAVLFDPQHDRLCNLNTTACEMLLQLGEGKTEKEITSATAHKYGVDESIVADDLSTFLSTIRQQHLTPNCAVLSVPIDPNRRFQIQNEATFPWYGKTCSKSEPRSKRIMIVKALFALLGFDLILTMRSFNRLCSYIHRWPVRNVEVPDKQRLLGDICSAVDTACIWYPKKALCLQRSVVTVCLLRRNGIDARLVVGVHALPFSAHAWVEANGAVVNDYPTVRSYYQELTSY